MQFTLNAKPIVVNPFFKQIKRKERAMKSRVLVMIVSIGFLFSVSLLTQHATATIVGNPPPSGIPITGEWRFLVFLVEFEEQDAKHDPAHDLDYYDNLLLSMSGDPDNPSMSLRDYYREVSYFYREDFEGWDIAYVDYADPDPAGDGWIEAPQPYSHYDYSPPGQSGRELVKDVINDHPEIDYTQYQNNPNLNYASVIVIYSSGISNPWSFYSAIRSDEVDVDGLGGVQYCIVPEDASLSRLAHEVGHHIAFPDLYAKAKALGYWCIMSRGSQHPDALCKIIAGWIEPEVVKEDRVEVPIPDIEHNRVVFKLQSYVLPEKEYFLVANRQQNNGFDSFF